MHRHGLCLVLFDGRSALETGTNFTILFSTSGDAAYTLMQVALNDLLMIAFYVPICLLLLGVSSIPVPFGTIILAVCFGLLDGALLFKFRYPSSSYCPSLWHLW